MDLPPGRYQLRIGVVDTDSKRTGSVHFDLDVPDFASEPLMMSGLVLTLGARRRRCGPRMGNPDDDCGRCCRARRPSSREFRSGEELALLAEVYDNEVKTPHTVDITTSLLADDGREVYRHEDQRSSERTRRGERRLRPHRPHPAEGRGARPLRA